METRHKLTSKQYQLLTESSIALDKAKTLLNEKERYHNSISMLILDVYGYDQTVVARIDEKSQELIVTTEDPPKE